MARLEDLEGGAVRWAVESGFGGDRVRRARALKLLRAVGAEGITLAKAREALRMRAEDVKPLLAGLGAEVNSAKRWQLPVAEARPFRGSEEPRGGETIH